MDKNSKVKGNTLNANFIRLYTDNKHTKTTSGGDNDVIRKKSLEHK